MGTFSSEVSDWVRQADDSMEAVFKGSVQDVLEIAQRNVPVYTGYLRGSLTIGRNSEPADIGAIRSGEAYVTEILPVQLGDVVSARWTAEYAKHVEYGTVNQPARGFVRSAVQQWESIVRENEAKVGSALGR